MGESMHFLTFKALFRVQGKSVWMAATIEPSGTGELLHQCMTKLITVISDPGGLCLSKLVHSFGADFSHKFNFLPLGCMGQVNQDVI